MTETRSATRVGPDRLAVGPLYRLEDIGQELLERPVLDVIADAEISAPPEAPFGRADPGPPVELPGLAENIVPAALCELLPLAVVGGVDVELLACHLDELLTSQATSDDPHDTLEHALLSFVCGSNIRDQQRRVALFSSFVNLNGVRSG